MRPFQLSVPCEIFGEVHSSGDLAELHVCSHETGPIRTSTGFLIETGHGLEDLSRADVAFVPSWKLPHERPSAEIIDALQSASANGSIIVGLCLGAFVLAEAGLLDGRRATTHWAFADDFRRRFPKVELDEAQLFVDEGAIVTSAGVAAGVDCCLHLANRIFGAQQGDRIARNIVAAPYRIGNQTQFIERPLAATNRDARLRNALDAIIRMIGAKHTIDSVSRRLGMSRRSFTRHFQHTMGTGFQDWLAEQRLSAAARILEATSLSVDQVALETGFGSTVTFRARFTKRFGVSPSQWRKTVYQSSPVPAA